MSKIDMNGKAMGFDYQMNVGIWRNPDGEKVIVTPGEYKKLLDRPSNTTTSSFNSKITSVKRLGSRKLA